MTNCYECVYAGEKDGNFFCNFGDSPKYNEEITSEIGCEEGEKE